MDGKLEYKPSGILQGRLGDVQLLPFVEESSRIVLGKRVRGTILEVNVSFFQINKQII